MREQREAEEAKSILFKFTSARNQLKGLIQTKDEKLKEDLKENSSLVYYQLSQFIQFFVNYNLQFDVANKLLKEACTFFVTDKEKIH